MFIKTTTITARREVFVGFKYIGMRKRKKKLTPKRLSYLIRTPGSNWMRQLVFKFMSPSALRHRILNHI